MPMTFKEAAYLISWPRRDFDKGKAIERWQRKVTDLTGVSPVTAGPPKFSPQRGCLGPEITR